MKMQLSGLIAIAAAALMVACGQPAETATQATPSPAPEQPGVSWGEEEIRAAVAPTRAGRKLTPRTWPNGARVAVCLSFDVDNERLARGDTLPVPMSAGQYGATTGLPRVLHLLERHGLPASFYIPAASLIVAPSMAKDIMASGRHEIAVHGWIHESLPTLDNAAEEERLLNQAIEHLTKATGKRPVGYRAPAWAFSRHTLGLIRKAGFLYDTSMMAMDEPYELVADGQPTGLIELPVEWILDDAPYFGRTGALPSPELIFNVYRDEFDMAYDEGTMFMLTMHPHVVGHRSRMAHLDRLIQHMKARPDVWFATAEQIANYVKQQTGTS
jgi:peptidoglycan/xylan/chitin deacetylase (PgdA/CDA1 family)